jgi:uncharacterized protein (UPF0276 family)
MTLVPQRHARRAAPIPAQAGIGLRHPHLREILETRPPLAWLEVHSENYMAGGAPLHHLESLRSDYPLSLHGVGLSLGSAGPIDAAHLGRLRGLADRMEPGLVSEHLSWSVVDGTYLNDLLPLPYTEEALGIVVAHVDETQAALGRTILIENPSTYLRFAHSTIPEWEFLAELARRSGCGILLDVNNVYVSACNHGFDAAAYVDAVPAAAVGEIHLAGHAVRHVDGHDLRIDDHGSAVARPVWELYAQAVNRLGPVPTLIEWDSNIPALDVLAGEAAQAQRVLDACHATEPGHALAG